jgi:hypothetical protein
VKDLGFFTLQITKVTDKFITFFNPFINQNTIHVERTLNLPLKVTETLSESSEKTIR